MSDRGDFTGRLGARVETRPGGARDGRYISVLPGILFALLGCLVVEHYGEDALSWRSSWAVAISFLPLLADEFVIRKFFKPDFKESWPWKITGMVIGSLVFMPLIITPRCGWNNDRCKPVIHHQTTQRHSQ